MTLSDYDIFVTGLVRRASKMDVYGFIPEWVYLLLSRTRQHESPRSGGDLLPLFEMVQCAAINAADLLVARERPARILRD